MSKKKKGLKGVFINNEKPKMKKPLNYGYLMVIMCLGLTGCANKPATVETINNSVQETTISVKELTASEEAEVVETYTRESTTFRNTFWGDDKETVKRYEADVSWLGENDKELNGMASFLGRSDMFIRYGFSSEGKLVVVVVYPDIDYADNKDLYMRDYYDIKGRLNEMYGEPFTDIPDNYWKETSKDEMKSATSWLTNSEYIALGPVSYNNERWMQILYAEKNYIDGIQDSEESPTTMSVNGIRPEFKEAMDSYEAFFDEYVTFMNKYTESNNAASMLTDYANYITKYADTMNKMSALGDSELSTTETAYYVEVTARINKKLLEAIQ